MKRLALYAHFAPSPIVAHAVFYYLAQLAEMGFRICFISNSEISPESAIKLERYCERLIIRENVGLDFFMWQAGLANYQMSEFDELLLTNSSIIGPVRPLAAIWQNPAVADSDFWGATDNYTLCRHLQSYFLVFRPKVFRSECFARFWNTLLPYADKDQIIRSYEMGLTRWLEQNGFKWNALYSQDMVCKIALARRSPRQKAVSAVERSVIERINGLLSSCGGRKISLSNFMLRDTTLYYPELLYEAGMPFVKLALLKGTTRLPVASPAHAFRFLESTNFPPTAIAELKQMYPTSPLNI